ncbi:hypothetical protein SASPL_154614 [Salvia splendens]|uniref:Pentatricopeptide repeat-containing protein n=1 Tax=Salvia splendens TaxID=180675 RepID=A0A8X8YYV0_SALSN|nr:hypothetical protein SASPL_154614 [Salvia splendens]
MAATLLFLRRMNFPLTTLSFCTHSHSAANHTSLKTLSSDAFLLENISWALKRGHSIRNHLLYQLKPSTYAQITYEFRHDLHIRQKFIDCVATNCPHFMHSSLSLSAAIHVLVISKRVSDAQALILRMIRRSGACRAEIVGSDLETYEKCGSNSSVFDLLIRTFVQARKFREAVEVLYMLRLKNVVVSINACNSVLGGLGRIGWVDLVREVYDKVVRGRTDLNVYTLNIMVNVFCKECKTEEAKDFSVEMEERGIFPDIVTCNILINAYCREGDVEKGQELMMLMRAKGLEPSLLTYNSLIAGLCKNGCYERAKSVVSEMMQSGVCRDTATYNKLLLECSRKNNRVEAESVFREMFCCGVVPDLHGAISDAMKVRDEMVKLGCQMDVVTYNTILSGLCKGKMLSEADTLFNEMDHCRHGDPSKAFDFLKKVKSRGLVPDSFTYNTLIHGFMKEENVDMTFVLVNQMKKESISPDLVTYNAILDQFCRLGRMQEANSVYRKMIEKGINPDRATYTSLINECYILMAGTCCQLKQIKVMDQNSSQPTGKTVKTPVRTFVGHFRVSKQSKSYTFDIRKDSSANYNHKIQRIGSHQSHRREDVHDFRRKGIDTMQSIWHDEALVSGSLVKDSTLFGLTFGGHL